MSTDENVTNYTDQLINPPKRIKEKVYFYILRYTTSDEKFKIKAYINDDIKYTFQRAPDLLEEFKSHNPYFYILELDLIIDGSNRFYINQENKLVPFSYYRLRLSRKIPQTDRTFRDYNDDKDRFINDPQGTKHYFLFDVNFAKNFVDSPPGKNYISKCKTKLNFSFFFLGENVPLWNQLCLYTYYILHHQMYDYFDILISQFQKTLQETNCKLIRDEFIDFFGSCLKHLAYAVPTALNQHIAEKIIIRMTGVLPITRMNFDINSHEVRNFTAALVDDVQEHYDDILSTVTTDEWPLFRNGLCLHMAIELLSKQKNTTTLVERMKNETCKKDLVNVLLLQLEMLQKPILNVNWTTLLAIADPNIISLQLLGLTRSIQIYITSLLQYILLHIDEVNLSDQVNHHFDTLVFEDHLPSNIESYFSKLISFCCFSCLASLENIIFLLKFLQLEAAETEELPKKSLKIVNTAIESSITLRTKIQRYLYTLIITSEQFADIRFVVSYLPNSIILYLVQKRDLLIHLLNHANASYSYEFFKLWFFSFLLYNDEFNDRNKKDYQDLLEYWSQQAFKSYETMVSIMMDIDLLANPFKNQQYKVMFIHHMINRCFQQGKQSYLG